MRLRKHRVHLSHSSHGTALLDVLKNNGALERLAADLSAADVGMFLRALDAAHPESAVEFVELLPDLQARLTKHDLLPLMQSNDRNARMRAMLLLPKVSGETPSVQVGQTTARVQ